MPPSYHIADFGARGIAEPAETLELTQRVYKSLTLPAGIRATIYRPRPGEEYDSVGIQRAIEAANQAGGGTVIVPAGDFLIRPLQLRSHVRLHLEPGARLWGSPNLDDYRWPEGESPPSYSHATGYNRAIRRLDTPRRRLIFAENAENVSLTGSGQISGQAPAWAIPWMNSGDVATVMDRPSDTILFHQCRHVLIEDIHLIDPPAWSLVCDLSTHVFIRGVRLRCFDLINADGIDLVNTSHVSISDCHLHTMDDAICLKSTRPDFTMHSIVVTNCLIRTLCNALKLGTDSVGNFEDIAFSNIVIRNEADDVRECEGGINLCALDGGRIRNVSFQNIVMRRVGSPFYLVAGKRTAQQSDIRPPRSGQMEGIFLSGIQVEEASHPCFIVGQPDQPIRAITLENIRVHKSAGFYSQLPADPVPERPEQYPKPIMFGSASGDELPACGLYLRHVEHVAIRDFDQQNSEPDARPLIVEENCRDVSSSDARLRNTAAPSA